MNLARTKTCGVRWFDLDGVSLTVTGSVGVAAWDEPMLSTASLLAAADDALYRAKELGRNRTELYVPLAEHTSTPSS
jgi:diguanylate cyclase (GGDEF)-like protein